MPILSEEAIKEMQEHEWFHAIDVGEGTVTCGRFPPGGPQNQTLFSVFDLLKNIDVSGKDCLDIGATDGLVSFGLERLGARSVTATDRVEGVGFRILHTALESKVRQVVPVEISDIHEKLPDGEFDLIICAGVIYHMLNPLSAFTACRAMLRPGGLMIMETALTWKLREPALLLNSEDEENMESSTYWMPTTSALKGMAKLCHFDVLAARWQPRNGRGAVLGRAVRRHEKVREATTLTNAMHEMGLLDYDFLRMLDGADRRVDSTIRYTGPKGESNIDPLSYVPQFPFHAHIPDPATAVGRRDWHVVSRS